MITWIKRVLIGERRDIEDPQLFHKVSLVAFMAWVGIGADGLSSSAYGPEDGFRALGSNQELVLFLALATALTVFIISYAYSRIIEHFPTGGGGYVVATKLLGSHAGVISGCALLVDYVLTISVSIASGADQIFSLHFLVPYQRFKLYFEFLAIIVLITMNLRGLKESVSVLVPIFLFFVATHLILLVGCFVTHSGHFHEVVGTSKAGLKSGLAALGFIGLFKIFARAYAQGAGTYTGIEAVSNAVPSMREPKVRTAKRTMTYMATSLALTAGGLLIAYKLLDIGPMDGLDENGKVVQTLNAVLVTKLAFGSWFVWAVLIAEAALLVVAAQTGFIDGPRVMANMAHDSWLPHRFSSLSERLTLQYGIAFIGGLALITLYLTHGNTIQLVTMYSINVFITFSLTQLGMSRFWIRERRKHPTWKRHLPIHLVGLVLCGGILVLQVVEKFHAGGKETAVITVGLILCCFWFRHYYNRVQRKLGTFSVEDLTAHLFEAGKEPPPETRDLDRKERTAVLMVSGYNGLGVHSLLTLHRMFPGDYRQIIFISVGVLDSGNFKGEQEIERLKEETHANLDKYVTLARRMGMAATSRMALGTDSVEECTNLSTEILKEYPRSVVFAGKIVFRKEKWYHLLLHNQTAQAVQRRLEWIGTPMIILPVRIRA